MGLKVAMTYLYFANELWKFTTASIYKGMGSILPPPQKRE